MQLGAEFVPQPTGADHACTHSSRSRLKRPSIRSTLDRRFLAVVALGSVVSLVGLRRHPDGRSPGRIRRHAGRVLRAWRSRRRADRPDHRRSDKIVLLALGTPGAMSVFAPIQPLIGFASLVILAASVRWSLRRRALGCAKAGGRR
jgi:hypothetical protein